MPFNPNDPHSAAQPPTTIPAAPTDLIHTIAAGPINAARAVIESLGLRKYRVFLVKVTYSGPGFGEGNASAVVFDEILPAPKVRTLSDYRIATSSGLALKPGALLVEKISVTRRKEELLGQAQLGPDPSLNQRIVWGIQPRGQLYMELFEKASEPSLESFGWVITLNRLNAQIKGVGVS